MIIKTNPEIVKEMFLFLAENEKIKRFDYDKILLKYTDFIKEPKKKNHKVFGLTRLKQREVKEKEITEYKLFGIKIWTSEKTVYSDEKIFVITLLNQLMVAMIPILLKWFESRQDIKPAIKKDADDINEKLSKVLKALENKEK